MKLEIVRLFSFVQAFFLVVFKLGKIKTSIIAVAESAANGLAHVTVRVQLKSPGVNHITNIMKLIPSEWVNDIDGLMTASLQAAQDVRIKKNFPQTPVFVKLLDKKTYPILKSL